MKICFICGEYPHPPFEHGGIGTFTQIVGRELARRGHRVRVVGVCRDILAPGEEVDQGVEVERLRPARTPRVGWLLSRYELFRRVASWARAGEVDLVEVPDYKGWVAGWAGLPVPVVMRLHGSAAYFANEMGDRISRLSFMIEQNAIRRADYRCSSSRYTAERTRLIFGLGRLEIPILYNPMTVAEDRPPWAPVDQRVVFTGTLVAKKGVVSLIRAWSLALRAAPNVELHIYGKDGTSMEGSSMRDYLWKQLSIEERKTVFFHGHVSRQEVLSALRGARVAVFPSFSEAFGLAPLEAMAQGCPTIYTYRATGHELIRDGQDGLLVDPTSPEEIAGAINRILGDQEFASRIGRAGWLRVRQSFSTDIIVEKNIAYYRDCLARFAGPAAHSCRNRPEEGSAPHHATTNW